VVTARPTPVSRQIGVYQDVLSSTPQFQTKVALIRAYSIFCAVNSMLP